MWAIVAHGTARDGRHTEQPCDASSTVLHHSRAHLHMHTSAKLAWLFQLTHLCTCRRQQVHRALALRPGRHQASSFAPFTSPTQSNMLVTRACTRRRQPVHRAPALRPGHHQAGGHAGPVQGLDRQLRPAGPPNDCHLRGHGANTQPVRPGSPLRAGFGGLGLRLDPQTLKVRAYLQSLAQTDGGREPSKSSPLRAGQIWLHAFAVIWI